MPQALGFTNSTTDKVAVPNPLTYGAGIEVSCSFWVIRTAEAATSRGWNKGANDLLVRSDPSGVGTDIMWFSNIGRATTLAEITISQGNGFLTLNQLEFITFTYSESDGLRAFRGTRLQPPVEVTYRTRVVGAGDTSAESLDLYIGNRNNTGALAAPLTVAWFQMCRRRLQLHEIIDQWKRVSILPGSVVAMAMVGKLSGGGGTVRDLSPNGKHGTITGTTLAHIPQLQGLLDHIVPPEIRLRRMFFVGGDRGGSARLRIIKTVKSRRRRVNGPY
jgi:hypothetical protein